MQEVSTVRPDSELEEENRRLRRAVEELSILNQIGSQIGATMDLPSVVELIVQECVRNLNAEQAAVMLLKKDEPGDPFRTMARKAYSGTDVVPFRFGQQLTGWMLKNRKPLLINDLREDSRFKAVATEDFPIHSILSVPLRAKAEMVGLLNVFNKRSPEGFTREDQRLLSIIASQSSQVVDNARLYEELQDRKRQLEQSEAKYRALMQEAGEAILLASYDKRRILEVNEKAEELTGLPRSALLGRTLSEVMPATDFGHDDTHELFQKGQSTRLSVQFQSRSGEPIYCDISANVVSYSEHSIIQVICLDVTEREKLAAHLRDYAEKLEREVAARTRDLRDSQSKLVQQEKMAALGKLVAGIAHEMNTPIGTINSNADTLARALQKVSQAINAEGAPEEFRNDRRLQQVLKLLEDIARINKLACERIVGIVSSLRSFARLDQAELQVADLHEGLDSTLTLVHHELKNRIQVVKEYGNIPAIRCHPNQINQVFMNLLVNAAQAIKDSGQITIKTEHRDDIVVIHISDSGSGIPAENLAKIFDPGFTTKGVGVGTGLGLSICFKIAQDHGGGIEVSSTPGEGSTFTLTLPIRYERTQETKAE